MQTRPRPKKYRPKNKKRKVPKPGPRGFTLEAYQVLLRPLVTEKGTHQSTRHNAYTFQVNQHATKPEIKHAVEEMFNVRVTDVRTLLCHGKKRRHRNKEGQMPDWKKAVVTLHTEDKIEFF
jgi:large subunit ribosomal protein L23